MTVEDAKPPIPAWKKWAFGAGATLAVAAVWFMVWNSGRADRESKGRVEELTCRMLGRDTCDLPSTSPPVGIFVLAGIGVFMILLSAIVYAGRDRG